MRTLTWYIDGQLAVGTNQRETYRLDGTYLFARVWVHLKRAPTGSNPLILDINVDGETIFTVRPTIQRDETEYLEDRAFRPVPVNTGSLVTLDIDQVGSAEQGMGMTVGLDLEEV